MFSIILFFRGNTMKIHSVKKEDRGTYFCVADNGVGKPAKRNVALEVHFTFFSWKGCVNFYKTFIIIKN